jgi:hypothetical protein
MCTADRGSRAQETLSDLLGSHRKLPQKQKRPPKKKTLKERLKARKKVADGPHYPWPSPVRC